MRTHAFTLVLIYIWPCGTLRLYTIKLLYHHYLNTTYPSDVITTNAISYPTTTVDSPAITSILLYRLLERLLR